VPELLAHAQGEDRWSTEGAPSGAGSQGAPRGSTPAEGGDFAQPTRWCDAEWRAYLLLQWVPYGLPMTKS
jgi:hypothetical protein